MRSQTRLHGKELPSLPPPSLRHTDLIVKFFEARLPGWQGQDQRAALERKCSFWA